MLAGGGLGDLEYRAVALRAAGLCRAEQIAVGVGDQAALRGCVAVEVDQSCGGARVARGGKCAVIDDLEYRTVAVRPAVLRRAEQVAVGVPSMPGRRQSARLRGR